MPLFAVFRMRGPAWQDALPLEGQPDWTGHASFMNALAGDGFVRLGGPLEGSADVLLIVSAASADEVRARLGKDPWEGTGLLRTVRIAPWNLRLGSL